MNQKLLRLVRRQIHTIITRETIKPSSPTPSHLLTYNLSEMDLLSPKFFMPVVLFYSRNNGGKAEEKDIMLKKSLSQSLTRYYPFAGRLPSPASPYVDCNDEGVLFLEARNDTQLDSFQRRMISCQEDDMDQLFPDDMINFKNTTSRYLGAVQLTHFACGGSALAISLTHVIGDGCTLSSFLSHWASVARYGSTDHKEVVPNDPHYIQSPCTQLTLPETGMEKITPLNNLVSRRFVFPNSKLSELKNKVVSEADGSMNNPTRVEVLTSLIYKTAVAAAIERSGSFKPSYLVFVANVRDKFVQKLPPSAVGNFLKLMMVKTMHESETSLSMVSAEMRKKKLQLDQGIQSLQQLVDDLKSFLAKLTNEDLENVAKETYWCSSLCGFRFNKLDFGWGKPMGTSHAARCVDRNGFVLMDTADGDGIEVMMFLEKECMEIFENNKELLSYCKI
ncbi:hypothetical protein R6Q59_012821 [Mikania micrantha]|uniref:Transferase, Chloramphenicol acetyltransferase-like domain protein n=1 Tax=Mikania micrantha TaxID=192012 RepID=A0A5N6LLM3_9ASTR|nr:hypothetical protein E3N88_40066 [Mikania micrantha]